MPLDRYNLAIRDSSFKIIWSELDDFETLDFTDRFNMPGDWQLVTSKYSTAAQYLVQGNGLIFSDNLAGVVLWSGPITTPVRTLSDNKLTVSGTTDLIWVKRKEAWPITGAQTFYQSVKVDTPIRWYRLGDLSGVTAHDWGSDAKDGTYTNGPTLLQSGAVYYDTNAAVLFNGTNQFVSCPAGGALPTGNSPWTIEAWIYMTAHPAASAVIAAFGTAATHKAAQMYITTAGAFVASSFSGDTTAGAALSLNTWHQVAATWDGTTLKAVVDGAFYGTNATPGNMTINANPPMFIGEGPGANFFFPGVIGEVAVYTSALSTHLTTHYTAGFNATGKGLNQQQFDTQSAVQASTAIYHYVNNTIGPAAQIDRWPGDATNYNRVPLTMAADPAIGSTLSMAARFDNLLAMCQLAAVAGGDFGFKCVQSASGILTFTIYQPTDRSATLVLRDSDGAFTEYTYTQDVPTDNLLIIGGSGAGTARALQMVFDRNTLAKFGRIEGFLNQSGQSDPTTLQTVGNDKLARDLQANAVDTTLAAVSNIVYGRDYFLGDKITCVMENGTAIVTDVIREVTGRIDQQRGVFINPIVGSQDAAQANAMFKDMIRQLKAQGLALGYIEQVQ